MEHQPPETIRKRLTKMQTHRKPQEQEARVLDMKKRGPTMHKEQQQRHHKRGTCRVAMTRGRHTLTDTQETNQETQKVNYQGTEGCGELE